MVRRGPKVSASFYSRETKDIRRVKVNTHDRSDAAVRIACNDFAWDNVLEMWANQDFTTGDWLVYACQGRSSRLWLKRLPTQDAAEMWMIHHG